MDAHSTRNRSPADSTGEFVEEVEVRGHIIDSLILPKILDVITAGGGNVRDQAHRHRPEPPRPQLCRGRGAGRSAHELSRNHGTNRRSRRRANVASRLRRLSRPTSPAPFPKGFTAPPISGPKSASAGSGSRVDEQEMDCGIVVDRATPARCIADDRCRTRHADRRRSAGVRVFPEERKMERQAFEFMNSAVSTEKPKGVAIRQVAQELFRTQQKRRQVAARSAGRRSSTPAAASMSAR